MEGGSQGEPQLRKANKVEGGRLDDNINRGTPRHQSLLPMEAPITTHGCFGKAREHIQVSVPTSHGRAAELLRGISVC